MPTSPTKPQDCKAQMRATMRALRAREASCISSKSKSLADVFAHHVKLEDGKIVAAYRAFRDEVDPAPLIEALRATGHKIVLPVIKGKRQALEFRLFEPGDQLVTNSMGIAEPLPSAPALEPDIILLPLLAFDRERNRLGYGGGYYDRTLAELRVRKNIVTIGLAYDFQRVGTVPTTPTDMRLDKIITDIKVY